MMETRSELAASFKVKLTAVGLVKVMPEAYAVACARDAGISAAAENANTDTILRVPNVRNLFDIIRCGVRGVVVFGRPDCGECAHKQAAGHC